MINGLSYIYTAALAGLALYAIHILILIILYLWHRQDAPPALPHLAETEFPRVTVQVPLCNERYVVKRILDAVAALDWPRGQLEIQVLDDSTDETTDLARAKIQSLQTQGYTAHLLHRQYPTGHKAGALAIGLQHTQSDFIAIFDADFCPQPDFLRQTVPYLIQNTTLGMVQARWEHLNAEYSPVTRAQALLLDAHFTVEHIARNRSGLLMNFNGTAGVWRRQAIVEAGGWQSDTVAEDLDISYRAQLAGWQIAYLPHVIAPAELPPLVAAFKQQQYRWAKGATQVLRKLAIPILRSPRLNIFQKTMALLHLSGYMTQPLFLILLLLTLPTIFFHPHLPTLVALLGTITTIPPLLYLVGQIALRPNWPRRILAYPVLMLLGLGITWSSTLAILDGLSHWGGTFKRTPKFQLKGKKGKWDHTDYRIKLDRALLGECLIGIYALLVMRLSHQYQQTDLIPFSLIYLSSEILIIASTLHQATHHKRHPSNTNSEAS
ncbi:MAG: glycosyltransferase [Anaerolineae bacterium]|nr:glycosyltransferase [Anaerolineae bacterium]